MRIVRITLPITGPREVKIMRPLPKGDDFWGDLLPLQGTPWGDQLPIVSGENLSHALLGHTMPLMREIGPDPRSLLRLIPSEYRVCAMFQGCINFEPKDCHPGATLPACYEPPGLPQEATLPAAEVALSWAEGRYVILVQGAEFTL